MKNVGSSFDSWLEEEGIREQVTAHAIKRVLARQIEAAMKEEGLSKTAMADEDGDEPERAESAAGSGE